MKIIIGKLFVALTRFLWNCVYASYRSSYRLAKSFRFNGNGILMYGKGQIIIGDNTYLGRHSSIQSSEGCSVKIGSNCSISHYVMIYTENNIANQNFSRPERIKRIANVVIGNNCWIGAGVFIREGVTIGDNVVIGANSVVVTDIPSFSIYAGIPAELKRKITNEAAN